jgi:hypothetical protein
MTQTVPPGFLPLVAVLACLWIVFGAGLSLCAGWRGLARRFKGSLPADGEMFRRAAVSIGEGKLRLAYGTCVTVRVGRRGVGLQMMPPLHFVAPTLFVPWVSIHVPKPRAGVVEQVVVLAISGEPKLHIAGAAGRAIRIQHARAYLERLERMGERIDRELAASRASRVGDLQVQVSAVAGEPRHYRVSVHNSGERTFQDLRIRYEPILLEAERFGLDATHMPTASASIPGEPIVIDSLAAGETVDVVRQGYGEHARYDGPRDAQVMLEFRAGQETFRSEDRRWTSAVVDLPRARVSQGIRNAPGH